MMSMLPKIARTVRIIARCDLTGHGFKGQCLVIIFLAQMAEQHFLQIIMQNLTEEMACRQVRQMAFCPGDPLF